MLYSPSASGLQFSVLRRLGLGWMSSLIFWGQGLLHAFSVSSVPWVQLPRPCLGRAALGALCSPKAFGAAALGDAGENGGLPVSSPERRPRAPQCPQGRAVSPCCLPVCLRAPCSPSPRGCLRPVTPFEPRAPDCAVHVAPW